MGSGQGPSGPTRRALSLSTCDTAHHDREPLPGRAWRGRAPRNRRLSPSLVVPGQLVPVDRLAELGELLGVLDRYHAVGRRRTLRVLVLVAEIGEHGDDVVPAGCSRQRPDDTGVRTGVVAPAGLVRQSPLGGRAASPA